ncbi:MAG: glycosyltransferase family 39 protein [Patescibacteria group bacterium]
MNKKLSLGLLFVILVIATFFRVWRLDYQESRTRGAWPTPASTPPGLFPDEAMNGNNAHEALGTLRSGQGFQVYYPENFGREGLFINLQALSIKVFGHTSFALRIMSALFGILTVLAIYLFTREYTKNEYVALIAGALLATSFWHVMFSRIGFRAIMAPFFLTAALWALYYVYNRLDNSKHTHLVMISVLGGIFFGLGFYSYIAYRVAPLLLLPVLFLFYKKAKKEKDSCIICLPAIYLFAAFIVAIPIGLYYTQHPQDFFGRTSQISIFSQPNPLEAFATNLGKTVGMLYYAGDFNWRHNWPGLPSLWWPVAIFFTVGLLDVIRKKYWLIPLWLAAMTLPVAISSEGLPHALRAIVMIPPVYVCAALGFYLVFSSIINWFKKQEEHHADLEALLKVIQFSIGVLGFIILIAVGSNTYNWYFLRWSIRPEVAQAFGGDLYQIGLFLTHPEFKTIPKYIITSSVDSIDVTGRPMELEPILFASETYLPDSPGSKNTFYLTLKQINTIQCNPDCAIIPIDNLQPTLGALKKRIPSLKLCKSSDSGLLVAWPAQKPGFLCSE